MGVPSQVARPGRKESSAIGLSGGGGPSAWIAIGPGSPQATTGLSQQGSIQIGLGLGFSLDVMTSERGQPPSLIISIGVKGPTQGVGAAALSTETMPIIATPCK
jgi:hypothetical protein